MAHAGTAIRAMREAQGLSLRDLARLADVDHAYLHKVEAGDRIPTARWLQSVTEALGRHLGGDAA